MFRKGLPIRIVLFLVLVVLVSQKTTFANTQVRGKLKDADFGDYREMHVEVFYKAADNTWVQINSATTVTTFDGKFDITIPSKYGNQLESGDVYIRANSLTGATAVQHPNGSLYSSNLVPIRNEHDPDKQTVTTNLGGVTKDAFKTANNASEVKAFYTRVAAGGGLGVVDENLMEKATEIKAHQVNIIFPSTEDTGHDPKWAWQGKDVIHIQQQHFDSKTPRDGHGDTVAHEYSHVIWNKLYGDVHWYLMTRKLSPHFPGDVVDDDSAFVENLSYFFESVFDGGFEQDAKEAVPANFTAVQGEKFDKEYKLFHDAQEKWKEAVRLNNANDIQKYARIMQSSSQRADEERLKYNNYVKALKKNPDTIDGLGANIFWDMYYDTTFGDRDLTMQKFFEVLSKKSPDDMTEFYKDWTKLYPNDKSKLEAIYKNYGYFQDNASYQEIPEPDWGDGSAEIKKSSIIVVDASGSMSGEKLKYAKRHAKRLIRSAKKTEEVALIVFRDCGNISIDHEFTLGRTPLHEKVNAIQASSGTPIASALTLAIEYMNTAHQGEEGKITLITDGGESCSKNPKEAAAGIKKLTYKMDFDVVGYNLSKKDKKELKDIAKAGGGEFKTVKIWEGWKKTKEEVTELAAVGATTAALTAWAMSLGQVGNIATNAKNLSQPLLQFGKQNAEKFVREVQRRAPGASRAVTQNLKNAAQNITNRIREQTQRIRERSQNK